VSFECSRRQSLRGGASRDVSSLPGIGPEHVEETRNSDMGIFSRITEIANSNINAILDKAEDPQKIVRLMIQEMEDTLVEVRSAAARAIADKKEVARTMRALERDVREWQDKAVLALDKGREDLAKAALAEKARLGSTHEGLEAQYAAIEGGLGKLSEDIAALEAKLADAKTRQRALVARHQTVSQRLAVRKKIHDYRIDDAMLRFEEFERRMDDMEGRVEVYDLAAKKDLKEEFSALEAEDAVEKELRALKERRATGKSTVESK
jgi:phage shock protein A